MYTVYVDDNYHYQDESERVTLGTYKTYEGAVWRAQHVVGKSLATLYTWGMTPEALLQAYKMFGKDPFIIPNDGDKPFSAWTYAEEQVHVLCNESVLYRLVWKMIGW